MATSYGAEKCWRGRPTCERPRCGWSATTMVTADSSLLQGWDIHMRGDALSERMLPNRAATMCHSGRRQLPNELIWLAS